MKGTYLLFDVPFDRSQSALPVPVFNNDGGGGSRALQQNTSWGGWFCVQLFFWFFGFFEVVDGQALIRCFLFYF